MLLFTEKMFLLIFIWILLGIKRANIEGADVRVTGLRKYLLITRCPLKVGSGIVTSCSRHPGAICNFTCDAGFYPELGVTSVICGNNGQWARKNVCIEINRGLIASSTNTKHIYTLPTAPDGTPSLDLIRSSRFPLDVRLLSVDGDYILKQAYVYDYYTKAIYKNTNFSIGPSGENEWAILYRGLSKAYVKLAVDWISHNIYWTDPQYKWIMVQSILENHTSTYRVLIHEDLEGPHALAIDPMEALLFWSDIGTFIKIEVSSLSGRNRKSLLFSNLLRPFGLAADHVDRRLYFNDAGRETVESITYEGKERKILLRGTDSFLFDIAVYKEYLYVTDIHNDEIYFLNKTNGKELHEKLSREDEIYLGVAVFHPDAQPTSATDHCVNYGCEHICVTEKDGATCLCKDGYSLSHDMKSCALNTEYFHRGLIFSNKSSICIVDIRVLTDFVFDPKCILKTNGTKNIILDTDQRQIIFANDTAIYFAMVDTSESHRLTELSGIISGLAWDGYDRNVYWTEMNGDSIWRLSIQSEIAQVVLDGLYKPRDILILPHERLMYWISDRNGSSIESSKIDGSNHKIILTSGDVVDPKSLSSDPYEKRIYFLDTAHTNISYVISCKMDGSDLHHFAVTNKSLEKLEIYRGYLLVTAKDADGTFMMSYSIALKRSTTSGVFPRTGIITAIRVFDETFRQNETGPCFNLNGECEQICISNGMSRICECTFGFRLESNGKTCTSDPVKDNFMLLADYTHDVIYQISLIDQSIQGIKAKRTHSLTGLTYSPVNDVVIWGTDSPELSIMHLNGTGKTVLFYDDVDYYPTRFAVDYSTGNIYYTAMNFMHFTKKTKNFIRVKSANGKQRVLVTELNYPTGLVVYPSKGLLFYTDSGDRSYLNQINMDGSQSEVLLNIYDDWATDLTVDYKRDYLYWINYLDSSIQYCSLAGTNHNTLTQYPDTILNGLALYQGYLFVPIIRHRMGHLIRVNISNTNETIEFATYGELGTIRGISIYSSRMDDKNDFCSISNGGCSTFCFPIKTGVTCSCEDGIQLREGSRTVCSNIPQCPELIYPIIVSTHCQRVKGSSCNFTCIPGYKARPGVDKVICNGEKYIPEDPCEESHAVLSADKEKVLLGIIVAGVAVGVGIVIVICLFIVRKKRLKNNFAPKRLEEEEMSGPDFRMNTSHGPEAKCVQVTYQNCSVDIRGHITVG
ncbi:hypothetical protein CHS0354_017025 [Potamilus streckersoni]|uniref:Sushi domain-containing protein n=1 Tax=Potamilus streckersoni TaxID=2493646 RepID=A0AAE0W524_9BIVA|nr:hypothetical protein CHS0354_017025 [Potamilus streckersoni]